MWSTQEHEFSKLDTVKSIFQKRCIFKDFGYFIFREAHKNSQKLRRTPHGKLRKKRSASAEKNARLFDASVWAKPLASAWIDFADEGEDAWDFWGSRDGDGRETFQEVETEMDKPTCQDANSYHLNWWFLHCIWSQSGTKKEQLGRGDIDINKWTMILISWSLTIIQVWHYIYYYFF